MPREHTRDHQTTPVKLNLTKEEVSLCMRVKGLETLVNNIASSNKHEGIYLVSPWYTLKAVLSS